MTTVNFQKPASEKMMISETDKAWFAGFFDGEGCILINYTRCRDKYFLELAVGNTFLSSLKKCLTIWNCGHIDERTSLSRVHKKWNTYYVWRVSHIKARDILRAILPYLIVKRQEAEVALQFALRHNIHKPKSMPTKLYNQDAKRFKEALEALKQKKKINIALQGKLV